MTRQEAAIQYIETNYLQFNRLRYDVVGGKLQIRDADNRWREMSKQEINSAVCACAQEYQTNVSAREIITVLQSNIVPFVHPLREYVLSLQPYTPDQPDWIDWVASQVRVKNNDNIDNLRPNRTRSDRSNACEIRIPLGAQGEYSSPRQEVDCRGMLSKLSSIKKHC